MPRSALEVGGECCDRPENCCDRNFSEIPVIGGSFSLDPVVAMSLPFTPTNNECDARMAIWQLTSFDRTFSSKAATSQVILKNASRVVAPGNGSRPSMNSLTECMDIHGVPGVDVLDISPVKLMGSKWIDDCEMGGSRLDFGDNQDKVIEVSDESKPSENGECARSESLIDLSDCESTEKEIVGTSEDEITSGSDLMIFRHTARITAWAVAA